MYTELLESLSDAEIVTLLFLLPVLIASIIALLNLEYLNKAGENYVDWAVNDDNSGSWFKKFFAIPVGISSVTDHKSWKSGIAISSTFLTMYAFLLSLVVIAAFALIALAGFIIAGLLGGGK